MLLLRGVQPAASAKICVRKVAARVRVTYLGRQIEGGFENCRGFGQQTLTETLKKQNSHNFGPLISHFNDTIWEDIVSCTPTEGASRDKPGPMAV